MQENNCFYFQALFNNDLLGCILVDPELNVLDYNKLAGDEVQSIFGKEINQGQSILEFVRKTDLGDFVSHFNQCLCGEKIVCEKEMTPSANGLIKWFCFQFIPLAGKSGAVDAVCLAAEKIDRQMRYQSQLKKNEKLYQLLANIPSDVIWLMNDESEFEYISPSVEKIFGIPASVFYNDPYSFMEIVVPEDLSIVKKMVGIQKEFTDEPFASEYRIKRADGTLRWIQTQTCLISENDDLMKVAGYSRDITERKQFEQDLSDAKKRAEESDHLKEAFLRNISHEIRTPMNAILGFSELLCLGQLEEENQDQYLENIKGSTNKLLEIMDDIMVVSQLESGNLTLNPEMVNPVNVIDELFQKHCNMDSGPVVMEKETCAGMPLIWVDRERLLTVLEKLIDNAIKFTERGSVKLGFECLEDGVRFFVKDTGIGIDESSRSLIFEPFRQVDAQVNRRFEGNGLGLTIASRTAHIMNTQIQVDSLPGKGSCFYFDLKNVSALNG